MGCFATTANVTEISLTCSLQCRFIATANRNTQGEQCNLGPFERCCTGLRHSEYVIRIIKL